MKAFRLAGSAERPGIALTDVPQPKPGSGDVSVRVYAAGVTSAEPGWYPSTHARSGEARIGAVPCHEFSGEVAEIGGDVQDFAVGQPLYGMNDWFADGALAEYCITQPEKIAPKPARLSHAEAASVPIAALTAWQGLFDHAKLQAGERVLVQGGAGAVGVFAVQLAHRCGAKVAATVSARNIAFVKDLGADRAIDYHAARFEDEVRDIDVVFDAAGGDTTQRSWSVLKQNGRLVTIASGNDGSPDERVQKAFFIMEPNHAQLVGIGRLLDAGELRPVIDIQVPFSRAPEVYAGTIGKMGRGKVVIVVSE